MMGEGTLVVCGNCGNCSAPFLTLSSIGFRFQRLLKRLPKIRVGCKSCHPQGLSWKQGINALSLLDSKFLSVQIGDNPIRSPYSTGLSEQ